MDAIRDYRPVMIDPKGHHKQTGLNVTTCHECRAYVSKNEVKGYRCLDYQKSRAARLAAHTKLIRREMARRGFML